MVCPQDTRERDRKKNEALTHHGVLTVIYECEWQRMKRNLPKFTSGYSPFFYSDRIHQSDILAAIAAGTFFGMANINIITGPNAKQKFLDANFPPLFKRDCPDLNELSDSMREFYSSYGTKPKKQLTVGFSLVSNYQNFKKIEFFWLNIDQL